MFGHSEVRTSSDTSVDEDASDPPGRKKGTASKVGVLELAKHRGWEAPDVGVPIDADPNGQLDAAWVGSRRAVSSTVKPGRMGQWKVERPGEILDELADGLR